MDQLGSLLFGQPHLLQQDVAKLCLGSIVASLLCHCLLEEAAQGGSVGCTQLGPVEVARLFGLLEQAQLPQVQDVLLYLSEGGQF